MEYNQDRKSQAANQPNRFGKDDKEKLQAQKQAADPRQSQEQQQGFGKKPQQQQGSPYNKPSDPKQQEKNPR